MPQISLRIIGIDITQCSRIYRRIIPHPFLILNIDPPFGCKKHTISSITGRHHAIEHIYSPLYTFEYIFRRPDSHQITWFILRQYTIDDLDHGIHFFSRFSDSQTTDRIAGSVQGYGMFCSFLSQVPVSTSLNDRK